MARRKKSNKGIANPLSGMKDVLPKESEHWKSVFQSALEVSRTHDFHYIETPVLERASIFKRARKLKTEDNKKVALKSDATTAVVRSYIEHQLGYFSHPLKVFHISPVFHENEDFKTSHRLGFNILGDNDPVYDGQTLLVVAEFFNLLGLSEKPLISVNTTGCRVCHPGYYEKMSEYCRFKERKFCGVCRRAVKARKFYELFSCPEEGCREILRSAPVILDYLCQNCNNHFRVVLELMEDNDVEYIPNPNLIRDLTWFNRAVFEFTNPITGRSLAVGGRHDYLSEKVFSKTVPGVGAEVNLDNLIEQMAADQKLKEEKEKEKVFFVAIGDEAKKASLRMINELRRNGIIITELLGKNSLSAQLRGVERCKAPLAIILGQRELFEGTVIVRSVKTGVQETVVLDSLVKEVKKRLK